MRNFRRLGRHEGVVFFEASRDTWLVRDRLGREWALDASPIRESDAFVLFDDRHCRGADMKLKVRLVPALILLHHHTPPNAESSCRGRSSTGFAYLGVHGSQEDRRE
jgi:hypothetical protein